ncbi:MAG: MFS transporter [Desulfobulbaceae bacterium]|nr:MFS transporter [Desulfobulbaceae bacterium]
MSLLTRAEMPSETHKTQHLQKSLWTFSTYFAEGFPYTIIRTISSIFFRDHGMSLEALGVTSIFGLPWVLKFLWGPQVDSFGTKRQWLLSCEKLLCVMILLAAALTPLENANTFIAALFFIGSFIAATHDIAIDGFYMEALSPGEQAKYLGMRVMAYRIAMMTGTGVIVTIGTMAGWFLALTLAALIMTCLFVLHTFLLPCNERERRPMPKLSWSFIKNHSVKILAVSALILCGRLFFGQSRYGILLSNRAPAIITFGLFIGLLLLWSFRHHLHQRLKDSPDSFYGQSFLSFIDRPSIGPITGFIIMIRTGEYMLSSMYSPFIVDLGLKAHYGWISAGVGLPCSIVGAMIGGWLISRTSLKKMIWPFLLLQNLTNIAYMVLALHFSDIIAINTANPNPISAGVSLLSSIALVHGFDQFSGGLGTAVLMTFLMRICRAEFKASHYAIGTGLMSLSGLYAGVASGFLTAWLGYGLFFGISFLLSIPGMILVFFIPIQEAETDEELPGKGE